MSDGPRVAAAPRRRDAPGVRSATLAVLLGLACPLPAAGQAFDAAAWRGLLSRYATEDGGFRYAALHASPPDRAALVRLAVSIGEAHVASLSRDAQLAFYLDAYNALVVKAVIDRWPIESVMRVPGFFDRARHRMAGRDLTLNELENDVIRGFGEPRVHFALNCASASCPRLGRTPYSGEPDLRARLEREAHAFVRRTTRVDRAARTIHLSQIFEWYERDFPGGTRAFVATRLDPDDAALVRDAGARMTFSPYDWALNARP